VEQEGERMGLEKRASESESTHSKWGAYGTWMLLCCCVTCFVGRCCTVGPEIKLLLVLVRENIVPKFCINDKILLLN